MREKLKLYYRCRFTQLSPLRLSGGKNDRTDNDLMLDSRGLPMIPGSALAGVLPRNPDTPAAPLPGEMLVLAHFRPGMLEGLLQGLRAAHVPPVALKAMLTDTNAAWTAPALYAEIAKEHAAMHGGGRAHKA